MSDFNATAYKSQYAKEHYENVCLHFPPGTKDKVKALAQAEGLSYTSLILKAITEYARIHDTRKEP